MNDIIPFGKYRGQEIEQIRQRDPAYLQWLVQQAWFSEKFAPTYQLVVNNFAPPSDETPAHNALQVRFLDFKFQVVFWHASGGDDDVDWANLVTRFNNSIASLRQPPRRFDGDRRSKYEYEKKRLQWHRDAVKEKWKTWRIRNQQPQQHRAFGSANFEDVTDVTFSLRLTVGWPYENWKYEAQDDFDVLIEIKPSMGDDYPAVLRQMKRQQERYRQLQTERGHWRRQIWCLLVDQFASQAVTLEQVRKIFERDKIKIVMMQDVRDALIKLDRT